MAGVGREGQRVGEEIERNYTECDVNCKLVNTNILDYKIESIM